MSSIIEKLHETVTPEILAFVQDSDGDDDSKKGVLGVLYGFLTARLTDKDTAERLASLDNESLANGELVLEKLIGDTDTPVNGAGLLSALSQTLGTQFGISQDTASTLSLAGLPLAYSKLKQLAGEQGVFAFLSPEKDNLIAGLPTWLTALLPAGLIGGLGLGSLAAAPVNPLVATEVAPVVPVTPVTPVTPVASAPTPVAPVSAPVVVQKTEDKKESGGFLKALLPFIAALILALIAWLMLKSCQKQPVQVAVPPAPTPEQVEKVNAVPATLRLALDETGNGLYAFDANVGSEGFGDELTNVVASVFGVTDKAKVNVGKDIAKEMPVMQYLPQLLGFMKGVPDASVSIDGKTIRLNASNPEALAKLINDIKTALPADFVVEAEPVLDAETAVAQSLEAAKTAIDGLTASSTADELVRALNLQIINFASGSSQIPTANQEILDKAAVLMNEIDNVRLNIVGHTDNQGSMQSNQKLSESRAKAVRDYLVSKGVNGELLSIHGASFTEPVASNATEQGRFANRRIEFALSKDGETIAKVGNADNASTTPSAEAQNTPNAESADTQSVVDAPIEAVDNAEEVIEEAVEEVKETDAAGN